VRLKNIPYPVGTYRVSLDDKTRPRDGRGGVDPREIRDYRPSIAILPLKNLSDDASSDYFSDGIVEDVIVSLAGLRELRVISRTSTLGYRSGETDIREVGKAFGVGYVLSGSIRRSAKMIRASVELSDAQSGVSVWADVAAFPPGDLFEIQDQLVRHIVTRIAPHIREEELRRAMRRRPESMTAYDRTLQALHLMDYMDKDTFGQARDVLSRAMEDDPHFAMPVAWSVWWHIIWVGQGWSVNPADDYAAASTLAERVVALDPNNALGLAMMAHLRSFLLHDYDGALIYFARALDAGPGNAIVIAMHALTLAYVGRGEEAVRAAMYAMRLSPLDHRMFLFHNVLAWANFAAGFDAEAVKWARACDCAAPRFTANIRILIAALAATGADEEARAAAARLLKLEPDFTLSRYQQGLLPYKDSKIRNRLLACLRSAGLRS
jgi:adenylate cyclase